MKDNPPGDQGIHPLAAFMKHRAASLRIKENRLLMEAFRSKRKQAIKVIPNENSDSDS